MLGKKQSELRLKLELNSRNIFEIGISEIKGTLVIGRSQTCDWVIPPADKSASNIHAKISVKGRSAVITDEKSRNGIYFKGEKISERKLAEGDIISVGDCLLVVEKSEKVLKSGKKYDALEQLNGENAGKIFDIKKENFLLGASTNCDIICPNSLVSQKHAEIVSDKDGCWIRDLGSRNGTTVNGLRMSSSIGDKGRLLRDGDKISIAYVDFRFLDKNVEHVRSHFWLKFAVVAATLFVMLGLYYIWQYSTPSSKSYIDKARICASSKNFEEAQSLLNTAANAKNADIHKVERQELEVRINQWRDTIAKWDNVKTLIVNRRWIQANKMLSPMLSGNMEIWTWNNSDAVESRNEAILTKKLTDTLIRARNELENPDSKIETFAELEANLAESMDGTSKYPEFVKNLIADCSDIREEMKRTSADLNNISSIVKRISKIEEIKQAITEIDTVYSGAKARFAERKKNGQKYSVKISEIYDKLITPLRQLYESQKVLDANISYVANFEFSKIRKALPLPDAEQCAADPILTEKRSELFRINRQLFKDSSAINFAIQSLKECGLNPDGKNEALDFISSGIVQKSIIDCDTLSEKLPKWGRTEGVKSYDKAVGVESFYEFIINLPEGFDSVYLSDMGFTPELFKVRKIYSTAEAFLEILEVPSIKMVLNSNASENKLSQWAIFADDILQKRISIIAKLKKFATSASGRESIVAGGMALLLSKNSVGDEKLVEKIISERKQLNSKILEILKGEMTPEEMIRRKNYVMQIGLPGHPQLRQIWSQK